MTKLNFANDWQLVTRFEIYLFFWEGDNVFAAIKMLDVFIFEVGIFEQMRVVHNSYGFVEIYFHESVI